MIGGYATVLNYTMSVCVRANHCVRSRPLADQRQALGHHLPGHMSQCYPSCSECPVREKRPIKRNRDGKLHNIFCGNSFTLFM